MTTTFNIAQHFNTKAVDWDEDPRKLGLARDIALVAKRVILGMDHPRLLDYGAGTGLVCLPLAPHCRSVLAMDVAGEMLGKLEEKSSRMGLDNVRVRVHDLAAAPLDGAMFDAILCAMTLHHIADVDGLLRRFRAMLAPGGVLMLADLDAEDGTFHSSNDGVAHHGFNRAKFTSTLIDHGFTYVSMETVHQMRRTRDGVDRDYPVFFASARLELPVQAG